MSLSIEISANAAKFNASVRSMQDGVAKAGAKCAQAMNPYNAAIAASDAGLVKHKASAEAAAKASSALASDSIPLWERQRAAIQQVNSQLAINAERTAAAARANAQGQLVRRSAATGAAPGAIAAKSGGTGGSLTDFASSRMGANLGAAGGLPMSAGLAIGGGAAIGLAVALKGVANEYDNINDKARQLGVSVEWMQKMDFAAGLSGTSIERVTMSMGNFAAIVNDAANGSGQAQDKLKALNLSFDDLEGKSISEQFDMVKNAINGISDAGTRIAILKDIFGRGGIEMGPLLADFDELAQKAQDSGAIVSQDLVESMAQFNDTVDATGKTLMGWAGNLAGMTISAVEAIGRLGTGVSDADIKAQKLNQSLQGLRDSSKGGDEKERIASLQKMISDGIDLGIVEIHYNQIVEARKKVELEQSKAKREQDKQAIQDAKDKAKAEDEAAKAQEKAARDTAASWEKLESVKAKLDVEAIDSQEKLVDAQRKLDEMASKNTMDEKIQTMEASAKKLEEQFNSTKDAFSQMGLDVSKSLYVTKEQAAKKQEDAGFKKRLAAYQSTGNKSFLQSGDKAKMAELEKQRQIAVASQTVAGSVGVAIEGTKNAGAQAGRSNAMAGASRAVAGASFDAYKTKIAADQAEIALRNASMSTSPESAKGKAVADDTLKRIQEILDKRLPSAA
jgi:hypothetical protein